jgi:hypothetical protein
MKIRNGFVSNSSSSSFIVFGKSIQYSQITTELIGDNKIYAMSYNYCGDGADFFPINQEMFDLFQKHGGELEFYEVEECFAEGGVLDKSKIKGDKIEVFAMDRDYHSVPDGDVAEFANRYLDLPEMQDPNDLRELASTMESIQLQMDEAGLEAYQDERGKTQIRKKE